MDVSALEDIPKNAVHLDAFLMLTYFPRFSVRVVVQQHLELVAGPGLVYKAAGQFLEN